MPHPTLSNTKLSQFPHLTRFHQYKIILQKETKSLIVVPPLIYDCYAENIIIYKYLFSDNTWKEYEVQPTKKWHGSRSIYTGAINKNRIYLYTNNHEIMMLELMGKTNKYKLEIIQNMNKFYELNVYEYESPIMINDELHYIADKHIKYNINTQIFKIALTSPITKIINDQSLIRIKDKLMLFGESMHHRNIYEYDITKHSWRCLAVTLPTGIWVVCCTPILNGQIILISVIDYNKLVKNNTIYIYEVNKQIIKPSNIKLPRKTIQIFAINNQKENILVTYAWIKIQCKKCNIQLPQCLYLLISKFCFDEILHGITRDCNHYRMNVFEIFKTIN